MTAYFMMTSEKFFLYYGKFRLIFQGRLLRSFGREPRADGRKERRFPRKECVR